jgi:serine/threonine protein kinase
MEDSLPGFMTPEKKQPSEERISVLKIFFNEQEESLKIINSGGDILKHLTNIDNEICPLMNSEIKLGKQLGEGHQGAVFEIYFKTKKGQMRRDFVVKVLNLKLDDTYVFKTEGPMSESVNKERVKSSIVRHLEELDIPLQSFLDFNNIKLVDWKYKAENLKGEYIIPTFMKPCNSTYGYACDPIYSEYLLSLLTGSLVRRNICLNFLDTFAFATCRQEKALRQYIFMEKANGTFYDYYNEIGHAGDAESVYIQVLFALAVCEKLKIMHNDLHQENIFFKFAEEVLWNEKPLNITNVDYFHYKIGERSIYFPATRFIAKLGDWGYGCKYSKPLICNRDVIENNDSMNRPSRYNSLYDLVFVTHMFAEVYDNSPFIQNIALYIHGAKKGETLQDVYARNMISRNNRPKPEFLKTRGEVSAHEILNNTTLMLKFLPEPSQRELFITIGSI